MRRNALPFALCFALVLLSRLGAQTSSTPPHTIVFDPAWSDSAGSLDLSKTRSPRGTARLANLSIRARAGSGADTLIAGANVQGTGPLPVLVRAIGPGLAQFGVTGFLREPMLEVFRGSTVAAQTNTTGPGVAAASAYVGAFPARERGASLTPGDTVLFGQAAAGTFTAHCSASGGAPGIALLEFYDAAAAPDTTAAHFVNLSSRARVDAGEGVAVMGFVVTGEGSSTLLLRGVGASLGALGVTGTLRDPAIELYAGSTRIAANDNWRDLPAATLASLEDARQSVGAFALTSSADAALLVTLPPGSYTMQLRSASSETGIALAEIHEISRGDFTAATSINLVGLDLFRRLADTRSGENLIVSPYSIETALALAYTGAAGTTRDEMARVLRLPADNATVQGGFAALRTALDKLTTASQAAADARTRAGQPTDPIAWHAANRLFGERDYAFRESFLSLMRDGFAAPMEALDFKRNFEPSRLHINAWVEEQTRQKIADLLPPGSLTEDTRLVLVNALYLKAPWLTPFEKSRTAARPFRLASGASADVPTLQHTGFLRTATEDGFRVAVLDYIGQELQFVIVLPDVGQTVDTTAARLTSAHFARWAGLNSTQNTALFLPKFKIKGATVRLGQELRGLGMRTAFDEPRGSANFDGIAPRRPDDYLALSDVYHQTFVAIDEEGTEAAAATAVVLISVTSVPPPPTEFRVDRPFLFAIQHRASGACLFFGRVMDPR